MPILVVILSLLWMLSGRPSPAQLTAILVVTIVVCNVLLLWRPPTLGRIVRRAFVAQHGQAILRFAVALVLGLGAVLILPVL